MYSWRQWMTSFFNSTSSSAVTRLAVVLLGTEEILLVRWELARDELPLVSFRTDPIVFLVTEAMTGRTRGRQAQTTRAVDSALISICCSYEL
jgi:hypothetical protein